MNDCVNKDELSLEQALKGTVEMFERQESRPKPECSNVDSRRQSAILQEAGANAVKMFAKRQ